MVYLFLLTKGVITEFDTVNFRIGVLPFFRIPHSTFRILKNVSRI